MSDTLSGMSFSEILDEASDLVFRIALLNLLDSENGLIYPYVEYQFNFFNSRNAPVFISDKYYTISALGKH